MLASITPLGERGRHRRWGATVTAYAVGSTLAGGAVGGLLGTVGAATIGRVAPPPVLLLGLAAVFCVVGAAADVGLLGPLPTVHRQVNEDWLDRYRGWVYGLGFGLQLGVGVVTIVTTAAVYVALGLAFLVATGPAGVAIGVTFGLVRALPVLAAAGVTTPRRLAAVHRGLDALAAHARWAAAGVQAGGGALVGVLAVLPMLSTTGTG